MNSDLSEYGASDVSKAEYDDLSSNDYCIDLSCVKSEKTASSPDHAEASSCRQNLHLQVPNGTSCDKDTGPAVSCLLFCKTEPEKCDDQTLPFEHRQPDENEFVEESEQHSDECSFETINEENPKPVVESAHGENEAFACSLCDFRSKWNKEYYKHMRTHFPGPPYHCDFECCTSKSERIQHLLYHRMSHTEERPYSCSVCPMKFKIKSTLVIHMRKHTGLNPFECADCNRSFSTKGALRQHAVTHSEKRLFLCDNCGFSTKHQSHLISHRRIHTDDVLRCEVDNCNYKTTKRSQLISHMQSHFQIKTFFCKECGQGFVAKSHLKRHHLTHVPIKPFSCGLCDYMSNRKDKLQLHVRKLHCANSDIPHKIQAQSKAFPKVPQTKTKAIETIEDNTSFSSYVKFEKMVENVDEQLRKRKANKFSKTSPSNEKRSSKGLGSNSKTENSESNPTRDQ